MTKDSSSPFVNISTPPTRCNSWAWCPRRRPRAHRSPHPDPPPRRGGGSVDGDWALGDGRALARVLLRFPSGTFALLVGRVLVRRKRPGSAPRPVPRMRWVGVKLFSPPSHLTGKRGEGIAPRLTAVWGREPFKRITGERVQRERS